MPTPRTLLLCSACALSLLACGPANRTGRGQPLAVRPDNPPPADVTRAGGQPVTGGVDPAATLPDLFGQRLLGRPRTPAEQQRPWVDWSRLIRQVRPNTPP